MNNKNKYIIWGMGIAIIALLTTVIFQAIVIRGIYKDARDMVEEQFLIESQRDEINRILSSIKEGDKYEELKNKVIKLKNNYTIMQDKITIGITERVMNGVGTSTHHSTFISINFKDSQVCSITNSMSFSSGQKDCFYYFNKGLYF